MAISLSNPKSDGRASVHRSFTVVVSRAKKKEKEKKCIAHCLLERITILEEINNVRNYSHLFMNLDDKELSDLGPDELSDNSYSSDNHGTTELDPARLAASQLSHQIELGGSSLYPSVPQLVLHPYSGYPIGLNPDAVTGESSAPEIKRDARGRKRTRPVSTAPKRNLSAYMFFANCHRPYVRKIFPDVTTPDITRILGRMWMDAGKEEKKVISNNYLKLQYLVSA